jgi:hypothetical protein
MMTRDIFRYTFRQGFANANHRRRLRNEVQETCTRAALDIIETLAYRATRHSVSLLRRGPCELALMSDVPRLMYSTCSDTTSTTQVSSSTSIYSTRERPIWCQGPSSQLEGMAWSCHQRGCSRRP